MRVSKRTVRRCRRVARTNSRMTVPDAMAMHGGTGVGVGYNVQIAVDTKHKLHCRAAGA